jgi:hypothetical protein
MYVVAIWLDITGYLNNFVCFVFVAVDSRLFML